MSTRSRKEALRYQKHMKKAGDDGCPFCEMDETSPQFIKQTKTFKIIDNIFPYSIWDTQPVHHHIMVVPKQHIDSLSQLSAAQSKEFLEVISGYEQKGYSVYARSPQSTMKTVVHQHTHLIKTTDKSKKFIVYIRKPFYFRIPR